MYTLFRAIGEVIDTHESSELGHSAEFRTDSMSFLNSINQPYKPSAPYLYLSFWDLADKFKQNAGLIINFPCVKAHAGTKGRERAGALANLGRGQPGIRPVGLSKGVRGLAR